jgi:hypothetical protein
MSPLAEHYLRVHFQWHQACWRDPLDRKETFKLRKELDYCIDHLTVEEWVEARLRLNWETTSAQAGADR